MEKMKTILSIIGVIMLPDMIYDFYQGFMDGFHGIGSSGFPSSSLMLMSISCVLLLIWIFLLWNNKKGVK